MRKKFVSALIAVCMCFHITTYAESVSMLISSSKSDDVYSMKISINNNIGISAGSFEIVYDGSSFDLSNLKGCSALEGTILEVNEDYSSNSAKVSFLSFTPITANGELVSFDITQKLPNVSTAVSIQKLILADSEENPIDCEVSAITVGDKSTSVSSKPSFGNSSGTKIPNVTETNAEKNKIEDTSSSFSDIEAYTWAKKQIIFLANRGIVNGIGNNLYSPGANVKRGDFICMLMRMLAPKKVECEDFADISPDEYWYDEIMLARGLGIAQGFDNKFNPNNNITRQDMFSLVYRAYEFKEETAQSIYKDYDKISDYAKSSINTLSKLGLIQGNGGYINPLDNATRAETAVMLYNIYANIYGEGSEK